MTSSIPDRDDARTRVAWAPSDLRAGFRSGKILGWALLLAGVTLWAGCLSKPALRQQQFLIAPVPPAPAGVAAARARPVVDDIVELRRVNVAPAFAGRPLVYRVSDAGYETDPYAGFLIDPERMLEGAVREWWRAAGTFRGVTDADSQVGATRLAELHVLEFYGDFRPGQGPAAMVTMRLNLLDKARREPGVGRPPVTLAVSRRVSLRDRTAESVVEGLQRALGEALAVLDGELGDARGK